MCTRIPPFCAFNEFDLLIIKTKKKKNYLKVFLESCFPSNEKVHKEDMVFGFDGIDN
jgi:hypothetical protein